MKKMTKSAEKLDKIDHFNAAKAKAPRCVSYQFN
jgi:hypothetical protein